MARPKRYASAAEKQRAYRERRLDPQATAPLPPKPKRRSHSSRLVAVELELRDLADAYRNWRDTMPENMGDSQLAEDLEEVTEQLDNLADEVNALEPPRGFGR